MDYCTLLVGTDPMLHCQALMRWLFHICGFFEQLPPTQERTQLESSAGNVKSMSSGFSLHLVLIFMSPWAPFFLCMKTRIADSYINHFHAADNMHLILEYN